MFQLTATRTMDSPPDHASLPYDRFPATPWTILLQKDEGDGDGYSAAWEKLARSYWKPLYAFLRSRGMDHDAAADDIQGFFAHLLQRDFLQNVDRWGGRFRSFLLRSLQNWQIDQHRAAVAQKRGGGETPFSLEELEESHAVAFAGTDSPEEAFDRSWAQTVFKNSVVDLETRLISRGRGLLFIKLRGVVTGEATAQYKAIAEELGMDVDNIRRAASNLRREFGQVLRDEIRRTVTSDGQVDEELRYLIELTRRA